MSDTPALEIRGLRAGYGRIEVVHGVDLSVGAGEVLAIVGANGAGKSTLLKTAAGLLRPLSGEVLLFGESVGGVAAERLVRCGVSLVPEGRLLFGEMSVRENLELGGYGTPRAGRGAVLAGRFERVFALFPRLAERADQRASTLSGGEQQMLAIGRGLMAGPRVLLLDEPSLGLAPRVIAEIFGVLDELRAEGITIVIVEQDARLALRHADRGAVMRTGEMVVSGTAEQLLADEDIRAIYLGSWHDEGSS